MPINLSKGEKVSFTKEQATVGITAENGWTKTHADNGRSLDYDLKGLVLYRDGTQEYIGAANADEKLVDHTGAVFHGGDSRTAGELEKITISWHADIDRVALSSYSALENGPGSFNHYGVFVRATAQGQVVEIPAESASADANAYTCLFAEVVYNTDGTLELVGAEQYSRGGSEARVAYIQTRPGMFRKSDGGFEIKMDAGPVGQPK